MKKFFSFLIVFTLLQLNTLSFAQTQKNKDISILGVGDTMVHSPQLKAQYNKATDTYDFNNNYDFIRDYVKSNDISICNLETTFAGKDKGRYTTYPRFTSPDSLATAIKNAGFTHVSIINNHTNDKGYEGYKRTIQILKNNNLKILGGRLKEDEKNYIIEDIKDKKIALTAYSYETKENKGRKTLNGIPVDPKMANLINTFNYDTLDKDLLKIKEDIENMKKENADIIVFYIHWGYEYHLKEDKKQEYIASKLNEYGVDLILGSHPHVVQPVKTIKSYDANNQLKKETLVAYSLGNILSNQCYEILKKRHPEDGLIFKVVFDDKLNKKASFIPTWVHRLNYKEGKRVYEILPLNKALKDYKEYNLIKDSSITRAKNALNNTLEIFKNNNIILEYIN